MRDKQFPKFLESPLYDGLVEEVKRAESGGAGSGSTAPQDGNRGATTTPDFTDIATITELLRSPKALPFVKRFCSEKCDAL